MNRIENETTAENGYQNNNNKTPHQNPVSQNRKRRPQRYSAF